MSLFISDAWAEAAPAAQADAGLLQFIPLIVIFALFYFLLIRPQMKRAKEHKNMIEAIAKNDEVITSGGILGRVAEVEESFVTLEIAEGVKVKVQKSAVTSLVPKGTYKAD